MNDSAHTWTEADFPDNEGILVVGDEVYFTPKALAKRLCLDEAIVRDRVKRKRIPSIAGLVDGERLVPLSLLREELHRRKEAEQCRADKATLSHPGVTPGVRYAAEVLGRRRG